MYAGNIIFYGDYYKRQPKIADNGREFYTVIGAARITDTLQVNIPLMIRSTKPESLQKLYPLIPLSLPVGAQVERVDLRLPKLATPGDEPIHGVDLPKNCIMTGIAGDFLKISSLVGGLSTVGVSTIQCSPSASGPFYTPNSQFVYSRSSGQVDQSSPGILTTIVTATALQVSCMNSTNTAPGAGIRVTKPGAIVCAYAQVIYSLPGDAIKHWMLDGIPSP